MITALSFSVFVVTTLVAIFTGFLWQDEYTVNLHGKYVKLFFGGKSRSLLTAHLILLSGFLIFLLLSPQANTPEMLGVLSGGEVMLLSIGFGGFLNWRVGPWSFAPRHDLLARRIIELSERGILDTSNLEVYLKSMAGEIRKGNTASQEKLMLLESRSDELGVRTKEILTRIKMSN